MDVLVIDLTHGGVKIAIGLKKLGVFNNIAAYDIYNTLKEEEASLLEFHNINVINNQNDVNSYFSSLKISNSNNTDILIVNPIHSPFKVPNINNFKNNTINNNNDDNINNNINNTINNINNNINNNISGINNLNNSINNIDINNIHDNYNYNHNDSVGISINEITHHKAVELILNKWKRYIATKNIPVIEVTGVKGKTSVVAMLKEILLNKNPLVLSSLGSRFYKNGKKITLKKNISITPASILETINMAKKVDNSDCVTIDDLVNNLSTDLCNDIEYGACIFESSLGVTGLGDVGVLTNLVENYPIAKNTSNARNAKKQVFDCDIVAIEKETLDDYYIGFEHDGSDYNFKNILSKSNTFSLYNDSSNVTADRVNYGLNNTSIEISYKNIKTISGENISGSLSIDTFAPGKHHVSNVLCAVTVSLSLGLSLDDIKDGLANFNGIKGRTSLKKENGSIIIEEINPGINTKSIESSIKMINDLNDYTIILGGKYGVTCEEIDENSVATLLDNFLDKSKIRNKAEMNKVEMNKDEMSEVEIGKDTDNWFDLILTDDLGIEIEKKMSNNVEVIKDPIEAQKKIISNNKNILFIYRSNYSQINKR